MLANLSNNNKRSLLLLFNYLYQLSFVPEDWKRAIVIPLPKPNKPLDEVSSYRPISLPASPAYANFLNVLSQTASPGMLKAKI